MLLKSLRAKYGNSYLNILGKPIDSLALSSIIEGTSEVLMMGYNDLGASPLASVFLGSLLLRGMIEVTGICVDTWRFKNYARRNMKSYINKFLMVDLERDITFYNIQHKDAQFLRSYYHPTQLFKYLANGYLILNLCRGFNYLLNSEDCQRFLGDSAVDLASYDPTFLLPLAIMCINFILIKGSLHPVLIHLRTKSGTPDLLLYSFMSGLPFVGLPLAYQVGWIGFSASHISIRWIKKIAERFEKWKVQRKFRLK